MDFKDHRFVCKIIWNCKFFTFCDVSIFRSDIIQFGFNLINNFFRNEKKVVYFMIGHLYHLSTAFERCCWLCGNLQPKHSFQEQFSWTFYTLLNPTGIILDRLLNVWMTSWSWRHMIHILSLAFTLSTLFTVRISTNSSFLLKT